MRGVWPQRRVWKQRFHWLRTQSQLARPDNEDRFRFLADMIPLNVWIAAPDGHITYVNSRMREYFGPGMELDSSKWVSLFVHPEDYQRLAPAWRQSGEQGQPYDAELRVLRRDGVYRWCIIRAAPQKDAAGRVLAWFGVTADIHDLKLAQAQLRDADRRKDEFLAMLAHELRNPLAPIRYALYPLRTSRDPAVARLLQIADRQINQLVRLVDDLLDVSRITRGKIELRWERVSLSAILKNAVESSRPLIDAAQHTLEVNIEAEPLMLNADPIRLAQVIANLLNNAAKYTEDHGKIWLGARRIGGEAEVYVRDTGLGIAPETLPEIFNMFAQARHTASRAQGGLGIGLTLARLLLELHGGRIEAHSEGLGKGSLFTVRIPLAETAQVTGKLESPAATPSEPGRLEAHRILIVDDNRDAADSLAIVLKDLGAQTRVAFDGLGALTEVAAFRPSVVLLDLGMPGMDGYSVARRLRQDDPKSGIVLIAISGWGQQDALRRSKESGFDYHLVKPVDTPALLTLLSSLPTRALVQSN